MPGTLGKYSILRTLGVGASCKVKLAQHLESGQQVAIKIMSDQIAETHKHLIMTEVKAMGHLKHMNIINQLEFGQEVYRKTNGKERQVSFIVLELAFGGELWDFLANSGRFNEQIARYFFRQFLEGLDYCHLRGVTHRDLKPQNLLLGSNYELKIADFGFAAPIDGKDGSGSLETYLGTLTYMAPEIHLRLPYDGRSIDVFAAGVILFMMVSAHQPFETAEP